MSSPEYSILYKDSAVVVANKPAGVPSQSDPSGDLSLDRLVADDISRPVYVVHRLDRPASGAVVFALSPASAAYLSDLLRRHRMERYYWAIVGTSPDPPAGTLDQLIAFDSATNKSQVVRRGGKRAVMRYAVAARSERYVMLEIQLETGRHHQIRAQLASIGTPIRGDLKYGARRSQAAGGIGLHAARVAFTHPVTGAPVDVLAPPPDDPLWSALTSRAARPGSLLGER